MALIICEDPSKPVKPEDGASGSSNKRKKGAYFHEFISKTTIKRKRIKVRAIFSPSHPSFSPSRQD